MLNLNIADTEDTPSIICIKEEKNCTISIGGNSLPENAAEFYLPLNQWVNEYVANPCSSTLISFKFKYLNSSSTRQIVDMLIALEQIHFKGFALGVFWHYIKDDELIKSRGEEIASVLEIPLEIREYES